MRKPIAKKRHFLSPVWILPILALIIGGWLLYKAVRDAGISITVHFENAEGVVPGKTKVVYKGIPVGIVRKINIDPDVKSVSLTIEMNNKAKHSLVKDTLFWLVKPEISAGRIKGLETLFSGSYIGMRPGSSNVPCVEFYGLMEAPPVPPNAPGLHIKLRADSLGSVQRGSHIYFKSISIGAVQNYTLEKDGTVFIDTYIEPKYAYLVRQSSVFCNASGLTISGDLSGFKFHMETLASLIYGGIRLYTPDRNSPLAKNGQVFILHSDIDDARFGLTMFLKLPSANGLKAGVSKVIYRGLELGTVTDLMLDQNKRHTVTATIVIDPKAKFILRDHTRFWVVSPKFSITGIEHAETLIKGAYITFKPGRGAFCNHFIAQDKPNAEEILKPGTALKLRASDSTSLSVGAPVLYRKFKVGEITGFDLDSKGNGVVANLLVYQRYAHLLTPKSVFFKVGGITVDANLDGISVKTGTISSILDGGVAFVNPGNTKKTGFIHKKGRHFILYESYEDAVKAIPALQSHGYLLHLRASDLKSIAAGSPILCRRVAVGEVVGYRLAEKGRGVVIDALVKKRYFHLINSATRFYNISGIDVKGDLSGIHLKTGSLKTIIEGGIAFFTPDGGSRIGGGHTFYLYDDYQSALDADKLKITIQLSSAYHVKRDMKIRYHGMDVGRVKCLRYNPEKGAFLADALVDRNYRGLFRKGTGVWIVRPEIGLSGIKHVDTVIGGPYFEVVPGKGPLCNEICVMDSPPDVEDVTGGLNIILETPSLGSLKKGSCVYYRQIRIGQVTGYELSPTARNVWVHVNILPRYVPLVRDKSRFWNVSGIRVEAGLFSGISVDTESLESIVGGGIAMATPETETGKVSGHNVPNGYHFPLYKKPEDKWLEWRPVILLKENKGPEGFVTNR